LKREPKYSGAESTSLYELGALTTHCHPTVRLWAQQILETQKIKNEYSGDPLLDFSIANFLDRIAYKEPKSTEKLNKMRKNGQA